MKKILALVLLCAILLSMVVVITSCSDSSSKHENDNIIQNEHKASFAEENRYNVGKMHFYLDNKKYYNISDIETATEAYNYMRERHSKAKFSDPRITITVNFNIDNGNYQEIDEKLELLSNIKYDEVRIIKYSPSVQLFCYIDMIDINELYALSESEEVTAVSVSFELVATNA